MYMDLVMLYESTEFKLMNTEASWSSYVARVMHYEHWNETSLLNILWIWKTLILPVATQMQAIAINNLTLFNIL